MEHDAAGHEGSLDLGAVLRGGDEALLQGSGGVERLGGSEVNGHDELLGKRGQVVPVWGWLIGEKLRGCVDVAAGQLVLLRFVEVVRREAAPAGRSHVGVDVL